MWQSDYTRVKLKDGIQTTDTHVFYMTQKLMIITSEHGT